MMKLKFRYDGEIHEIGLGTIKPLGKSLAIRYGGQIYYASLILAKSDMSSAVKISLNGEIFSLAQEPIYFTPDSEYSCEVPNTDDIFKLSGLNTNLGMLLIDEGYIKTLDGKIVGTFENGVITLFDEALPYADGVVGLTQGDYELVIAEKEVTPGAFTDIESGTVEYTTAKVPSHYESVGNNTYRYVQSSGGEKFQVSGLIPTITAENAKDFIAVDDAKKIATFIEKASDSITISSNQDSCTFSIASGIDAMSFTGSNDNDTVTVSGTNITITGGAGNDLIRLTEEASGVIEFSEGSDSVDYSANFLIDFGAGAYDDVTLVGDDVVFTQGVNSLTVLDGRSCSIDVSQNDGTESTVKLARHASVLTYDGVRRTAVTLNGSAQVAANAKSILFTGSLRNSTVDYAGTVVTITAAAGANYGNGIYIEGNAKSNVIYSYNVTDSTKAGNTIYGGEGNDSMYGTPGADVFIFKAADTSNDVICNYEANDVLQIEGGEGNITPHISGNNIVFRVGTYALTLRDVLASEDEIVVTVKDENGEDIKGLSGYTYYKDSGVLAKDGKVHFTSGTAAYTVTASDKKIDASLASASVVTIDMTNAANGLTINSFIPTFKLTGYEASNIYSCSYDESTGTFILGLSDNGTKVDKIITLVCREDNISNQLNIGTETVYIGENALYNAKSSARTVSLTSAFSGTFDAAGEMQDKFSANTTLSIDASRTKGVTLVGGQYGNTLIGSDKNDTLTGANAIKDVFVYSGGNDLITNYNEGLDVISLRAAFDSEDLDEDDNELELESIVALNLLDFVFDADGNLRLGNFDSENTLAINNVNAVALNFVSGDSSSTRVYSSSGRMNAEKTRITLIGGHGDFNLATSTLAGFASIESIFASKAADGAIITANPSRSSFIHAGNKSLTLVGGNGNDTLKIGRGDCSLVGGRGSNVFNFVGFGNATIADYTAGDQINASSYDMTDLRSVVQNSDGLQLNFTSGVTPHTLNLQGLTLNSTVNMNSTAYTFNATKNTVNDTANGRVTLLGANANIDLATDSQYSTTKYIVANNGGTITAASGNVTLGGYNVSLVGGPGNDVFVYAGGNASINSYGVSGNDRISLASGYSVAKIGTDKAGKSGLTIADSYGATVGYIYLENTQETSVRVMDSSGGENTFYLNQKTDDIFSTEKPEDSTSVIVQSHVGDYGAMTDKTDGTDTATSGTEHFLYMFQVEASKPNSFLTGNYRNNTLIAKGGTKNVFTGGLGNDTFVFNVGGGVIRDFGIGTTKAGEGTTLANSTTGTGFNRKDPTSYYEGTDTLRVKGTVVEIAYRGYDTKMNVITKKTPHDSFTVYVTYTSDVDGEDYTVALDNIRKKPTTTSTTPSRQRFSTNNVAVKSLTIYDTRSGDFAKIPSEDLILLMRSLDSPANYTEYEDNIKALETFVDEGYKYEEGYSENIHAKCEEHYNRIKAVYAAGNVTDDTTIPPA